MARHYYFAEPFPDELIGSVLIRTARHRGLGIKDFTTLLGYSRQSKIPLLLTQRLAQLSGAVRATPLELLHLHTPFRYITAFMSPEETDRFAASIIDGNQGSLASLVQSVTIGGRQARYCPRCIQDDLTTQGECYWHRTHNLPFVDACHKHGSPLHEVARSLNGFAVSGLPDDYSGVPVKCVNSPVHSWLAAQSIATLETRFRRPVEDWFGAYRAIAIQRGFPKAATGLCGKSLSIALEGMFGQAFFRKMNWSFSLDGRSWPALMFRDSHETALVTGKHLVVQSFLKFAPVPEKALTGKPGKKERDFSKIDQQIYRVLQRRMALEQTPGRPSAQLLMRELGIWETYKHQRRMLPTTNALVAEWYQAFVGLKQAGHIESKAELRRKLAIRIANDL